MPEPAAARKFMAIEAGRGMAATAVVLYHSARHLDHVYGVPGIMRVFQFGHAGVDLFFVISGFIILFVHYGDIGRPDRLGRYIGRRFTRILPTYWVALTLTILLGLAGGHAFPPLFEVVWSATLLPSFNEPLLGVAWTLQFEMTFYAVFCLLIFNRGVGLVALTVWLAWIGQAELSGGVIGEIPGSLYGMYNFEFFLGMGVAYWLRNYPVLAPRLLLVTGSALFVAVAILENVQLIDGYSDPSRLSYGFSAAMIVLGAAEADRRGLINVPIIMRSLGAASYSIYLFQFVGIGIAWKLWLATGLDGAVSHVASFPFLAAAGVAGGVAASRLVEYPLMGLVRRFRHQVPTQPTRENVKSIGHD